MTLHIAGLVMLYVSGFLIGAGSMMLLEANVQKHHGIRWEGQFSTPALIVFVGMMVLGCSALYL